MKFFGKSPRVSEAPVENKPAAEEEVDMTEVMAAVAKLNDKEPPSGHVVVPVSIFPGLKAAAAAAKRAANPIVGDRMADGTTYIGRFADEDGVEKKWFAAADDARDENGQRLSLTFK